VASRSCLDGGALEFLKSELLEEARGIDESNIVPKRLLEKGWELGLFEPPSVACLLDYVRAASYSSRGYAHVILVHGSSYLALGAGRGLYALSVTEPGGGSDVRGNLATKAVSEGGAYIVEGSKMFTSNALYADTFVVLADAGGEAALFLCPRSPAIKVDPLDLSGFRGSGVASVRYMGARCERVTPPGVDGLKEVLGYINVGRLGYAAIALGMADRALDLAVEAASRKTVFGRKLIDYQGLRWMIAMLDAKARALEALVARASSQGKVPPEDAAAAKVLAGELAREAAWLAVQVLGGRGLEMWGEAERMHRDSRVLDIGEGAREVLLDFIASRAIKKRATEAGGRGA
jgi:alkylation response protein AidB-like acyl-CoA dehydrogenase